jgi:Sec7-like guanine-nucleotide exchange factor
MSPKVLQESGFLPAPTLSSSSPEDPTSAAFTAAAKSTALFLFREGRLSKRQIGAFIGGHDDFSRAVLTEFVACHEFMHLILVQALRQFLWSFR